VFAAKVEKSKDLNQNRLGQNVLPDDVSNVLKSMLAMAKLIRMKTDENGQFSLFYTMFTRNSTLLTMTNAAKLGSAGQGEPERQVVLSHSVAVFKVFS